MTEIDPLAHYSPEPNIAERLAQRYLVKRNGGAARQAARGFGARIVSAQRWATFAAAAAGIISGGLIGGAELYVRDHVVDESGGWMNHAWSWGGYLAVAGVVSAVEILFIYKLALWSVTRINNLAGVRLARDGYGGLQAMGEARAALEFPNPRVLILGVDPYARMPRWRLSTQAILYRLKVGASAFAMRVLLRRVFGRVVVRGFLPLLAGPLYAAWNAIILWRILQEARVRALGPAAIDEVLRILRSDDHNTADVELAEIALQGAGELVMRACDAHPNYVALIARLGESAQIEDGAFKHDWPAALARMRALPAPRQERLLRALTIAAIVGSSVRASQQRFVAEAYLACGQAFNPERLRLARKRLLEGDYTMAAQAARR